MPNYTKLFNSIVTSTIWTEDDKTRIVWITMLAMSDQNGEVHASVPGLARVAGVTLTDCELALSKLLGPDPYSRTPDNEGRRIAPIDGGWELLNHRKYRAMASREDEKKANAVRQERFRARHAPVTDSNAPITPHNGHITENVHIADTDSDSDSKADTDSDSDSKADTDSDSDSKADTENKPKPKPKQSPAAPEGFDEFWQAYPKKVSKGDALKAWQKNKPDLQTVLNTLDWQKKSQEWTKDGGQYIPHPASYLNAQKYHDEKPAVTTTTSQYLRGQSRCV